LQITGATSYLRHLREKGYIKKVGLKYYVLIPTSHKDLENGSDVNVVKSKDKDRPGVFITDGEETIFIHMPEIHFLQQELLKY
jgi:hypothetical protein